MYKEILKLLTTKYRVITLFGDLHLFENETFTPIVGKKVQVKILGLIWVTYAVKYYG